MNKRPIDYKQYDSRWASRAYNGPGERDKTIKSSGCGPTCAAMVIATLADKAVTPADTCAWSVAHGYKYANQGTAYGYFVPQLAAYGIECRQLLSSRIINQPNHAVHTQVKGYLAQGYWVIALMGPGTWTTGGHYVLVWDWDDKVRINDPNSIRSAKLNGDPDTFQREVRMYWLVDARDYNREDDDMTQDQFDQMMNNYLSRLAQEPAKNWGSEWDEAKNWAEQEGIIKGDETGNKQYLAYTTRQAMVLFLFRLWEKIKRYIDQRLTK